MDNYLNNGAVLPAGLLGHNDSDMAAGFNKTYKNYPLRIGVVIASYPASDPNNHSKLSTEYDVQVIEQNSNEGATSVRYRNCMAAESMGSIADFLEKALRPQTENLSKGATNLNNQDGAIVLILCLDGMSDKAVIITSLTHPDRETTLVDDQPYLEGEYNGLNIKVDNDGSATLTFKGATDNQGEPLDDSQGDTVISIETDGSFQIEHDTITFRLDKEGTASLTTEKDLELTVKGQVTIMVTGDATVQCDNLSVETQGKVDIKTGADATIDVTGDVNLKASGKIINKGNEIDLNGTTGMVLTNVTDPVVDTIFGAPTMGVPTVKAG